MYIQGDEFIVIINILYSSSNVSLTANGINNSKVYRAHMESL